MTTEHLVIGDTAHISEVDFSSQANGALDLSTATLIQLRYKVGSVVTARTMTASGDTTGLATYQWTAADFLILRTADTFDCDFKITFPTGVLYAPTVGYDKIITKAPLS